MHAYVVFYVRVHVHVYINFACVYGEFHIATVLHNRLRFRSLSMCVRAGVCNRAELRHVL